MLESDYILRAVEQLVAALARVLRLKSDGNEEQAATELSQLGESAFGLSLDMLVAMSEADLVRLQSSAGSVDFDRLALLARFFKERGAAEESPGARERFLAKAAHLFARVVGQGPARSVAPHRGALDELMAKLEAGDLLEEARRALFDLSAALGQLARAENHLDELLLLDFARHIELAESFYQQLLLRSDAELEAGGLPRDEVQESLDRISGKRRSQAHVTRRA